MHIVMFKYNQERSAIVSQETIASTTIPNRLVPNTILANGYEDRFLWEEAENLKPKKPSVFHIPGNWQ